MFERDSTLIILQGELHTTEINGGDMLKGWKKIILQGEFLIMVHEKKYILKKA
jgi:hypothetical protein